MLAHAKLVSILDKVLNQSAVLRKGGDQATYFCKCGHYKRKLEVSLSDNIFHCWICNESGGLHKLLKIYGANNTEYSELDKLIGTIRQSRRSRPEKTPVLALPDEFHPLMVPKNTPEYKNALHYLTKRRHVSLSDILRYNIGYCEEGEYDGHLIFPSYDLDGKLNFFIGRRYFEVEGTIPYKKPDISNNVVGFEAHINFREPINICEGTLDALAIRTNAIPLFGKYIQEKLLAAIVMHNVTHVNLILDDDAEEDAINNYCRLKRVKSDLEVKILKLDGKDPSVLGYERMYNLIKNANAFGFEDLMKYKIKI